MFDYIHLSCKITQRYAWCAILRKVIHSDYLIPKSHPCGLLRTLADQASCWSIWWGKPSIYGFKFTLGLILLGWTCVSFFYPSKRTHDHNALGGFISSMGWIQKYFPTSLDVWWLNSCWCLKSMVEIQILMVKPVFFDLQHTTYHCGSPWSTPKIIILKYNIVKC